MPVNTRHTDYLKALPWWTRTRDFIAHGRDGVKAKGTTYLPRPAGIDIPDYEQGYLFRAPFFASAQRTARALAGTLTRKPAAITGERFTRECAANIDLRGTSLQAMIVTTADEMMQPSRFGILVDRPSPSIEGEPGQERLVPPPRLVDRPYAVVYDAESIINWAHDLDEFGVPFLRWVVLEEPYTEPSEDQFRPTTGTQWRVLFLDEAGRYTVHVYRLRPGVALASARAAEDFVLHRQAMPSIGATPWNEIPFEIFGPRECTWPIEEPLLLPVVNVNWDHYMRAADYVHSLHFTACPMPWAAAAGLTPDAKDASGKELVIKWGSQRVLLLPEGGQVGVAEVTGAGAEVNLAALRMFDEQAAHLGAQLLAPEKRAAEAADTLAMRSVAQTASLTTVARAMSTGYTRVARLMMRWQAATPAQIAETAVELNTDFVNAALSAQDVRELVAAHLQGEITDEDLYWNLERGERLAPGRSFEQWNTDRKAQQRSAPADGGDLDDEDEADADA